MVLCPGCGVVLKPFTLINLSPARDITVLTPESRHTGVSSPHKLPACPGGCDRDNPTRSLLVNHHRNALLGQGCRVCSDHTFARDT